MKFSIKPAVKITGQVEGNGERADVQVVQRLDGMWFFLDEDEAQILRTLDHDSDRAVGIIVGSMIEERLKRAIIVRMEHRDQDTLTKLFRPSGALGSFASKIDLAYVNGLISETAFEDLQIFKDIRNAFAHKLSIRNFHSDSIRDTAANFRLIEDYVAEGQADSRGQMKFMDLAVGAKPAIFALHAAKRKKIPRDRYLMTAQLFTMKMSAADLKTWPLPFI